MSYMTVEKAGRLGGKARARNQTPEERSRIARQGAEAKWRNWRKQMQEGWEELKKEVQGRCVRCGNFGMPLTKDHILRRGLGGRDCIENIQPLCRSCNASKTNEDFNWLAYRREHGWNNAPPQAHFAFPKKQLASAMPISDRDFK